MSPVRVLLRTIAVAGLSAVLVAPASLAQAAPSASELTQQINQESAKLEKTVESYNRLTEDIKKTKADTATLNARLGPLQQQVDAARAEVGQLAATAYKTGGLRTAGVLLGNADPADLTGNLGTLDQLARDRRQKVSSYDRSQRQFLAEKAELDETLARQTAQAKELSAGKKKIEADLSKLYSKRKAAYGAAQSAGSSYTGTVPSVSGKAGVAVRYAYDAIGKPYVWAADGPNGYDCSGLTMAAWRAAGKSLPHNAAMQWDSVSHISRGSLQPGDLVFYSGLGHVALFVGSGKVIHAPQAGENVKLASVDMMTPYGYGRVR
ncbi:C40 family peptidase [Plantactinospora sp. KBS50]|uniref:C40 family peptidase n=1 Tax=Plantactinospora sp. KBS50 TaxID=2024580 RepID=UPI000BAAD6ED|nr:C40 family peptidase [Plantactinospora sp. KBS50]ASW56377.1 glycoside hydrolase [Plantactinospora sp. KBS50]